MLTQRQGQILRIISREFITSGVPVSSDVIARSPSLGVSPATVRNEVVFLEREGYILRPHTSAGAVPSHKGYRYFVETMDVLPELPSWEQHMVSHLFHQVERDTEEWLALASSLLGRLTRYASVATLPRAEDSRLRHIGLVSLHQFLAMLILVLQEARTRQQLLPMEFPTSQEALDAAAVRLNRALKGMDAPAIKTLAEEMSQPLDQAVSWAVVTMMSRGHRPEIAEAQFHGWNHIMDQLDLADSGVREMMEALEEGGLPAYLLPAEGLRVVIGDEFQETALSPLSLVIASYGVTPRLRGFIGVVGPTRMDYVRAISAVKYVSEQLSHLVSEICS